MKKNLYNSISEFLFDSKYKLACYVIAIIVLGTITVSMVLNNLSYLGKFYEILEWLVYFLIIFVIIPANVFILVPRYLLKGRPVTYFIQVIVLIVIALTILGTLQIRKITTGKVVSIESTQIILNFISSFISMAFLITGSSSIMLFTHWIRNNRRINELESATLQSELDMLKSQINPHFLFNMLNNANVLIWKDKEEAARILYKLEDLLRYQLNETSKDKVLLTFDIRFLNDFLNLEKIRRDNFEYSISIEGNIEDVWIPSLMFIPFVENAVKHNPDSHHVSYVYLYFNVYGNRLEFVCENSKPQVQATQKRAGGLGLKNIKRRLTLLYAEKHSLTINDQTTRYIVTLNLELE